MASGAPFISCYYAFAEMFGQMIARRAGYASPLDLPLHLSALAGKCHSPRIRVRVRWWSVACVCSLVLRRKGGCGAGLAVAITTPLEILRQRGLTEWHHWNQTKEVLLSQGFIQVSLRTTTAALPRGTWRLTLKLMWIHTGGEIGQVAVQAGTAGQVVPGGTPVGCEEGHLRLLQAGHHPRHQGRRPRLHPPMNERATKRALIRGDPTRREHSRIVIEQHCRRV